MSMKAIKPLLLFINAVLLIAVAYFCVLIIYQYLGKGSFEVDEPPQTELKQVKNPQSANKIIFENEYKQIKTRNLFKVRLEDETADTDHQNSLSDISDDLPQANLDLVLWGTVTGFNSYAVIEDTKTKLQDLYKIGDVVHGATLKKIFRDSVILTYNNQDYVLEMDLKQMPDTTPEIFQNDTALNTKEISVDQSQVTSSLKNIDDLKRQIRIRPLTNEDKSDGLLIYSIRPDSVFSKLGLQNGDIIRQVNGSPALSFEDAVKIYQNNKDASEVKVSILRNGKLQEIIYHIRPDEKKE